MPGASAKPGLSGAIKFAARKAIQGLPDSVVVEGVRGGTDGSADASVTSNKHEQEVAVARRKSGIRGNIFTSALGVVNSMLRRQGARLLG